ncbi:hypothetical protein KKF92_02175 [Patescibacteria group bacterium]|nr:hypothetical protein [Patescibacteria group bacterium]
MKQSWQPNQTGQIAVSILLVMSVLVVISFSLASRTTQEINLTTQTTESAYVFNAAESGVNEALAQIYSKLEAGTAVTEVSNIPIVDAEGKASVTYSIDAINQIETRLMEGNSLTIELDPANLTDVNIDWAKEESCTDQASIIVTIYSTVGGETVVSYTPVGVTANGCGHDGDEFDNPTVTNPPDYKYRYTVSGLTTDDLFIRIMPVYNNTNLLVAGAIADRLPIQAYIVESRAINLLGDSQETRALRVVRTKPVAPAILDYVVYTGDSLVK